MSPTQISPPALGLRLHRQRERIDHEIQARPFEEYQAPLRGSHLVLAVGQAPEAAERDRDHLADLCARFEVAGPEPEALHHSVDCGPFRLKWERHLEFCTYTIVCRSPYEEPFADPVICQVPDDWLGEVAGELLVATHLVLEPYSARSPEMAELQRVFGGGNIAGALVTGGAAEAWSDFRIHDDGFGRILIKDRGLRQRQAGRLVKRLLDVESYRTLAMLGHPLARQVDRVLSRVETRLGELGERVTDLKGLEAESALLDELSALSAEVERSATGTAFRFGASRTYHSVVRRRIAELREERIEGIQTIREFMDRRLAPAMATVEAVTTRQDRLAARVARMADLLRTRVDVALEHQNRDLLSSMDRRIHLQIRLQETVEGLSVVVLTYYLSGLTGYVAKALAKAGLPVQPELAVGVAVPFLFAGVWLAIRRLKRRVARDHPH